MNRSEMDTGPDLSTIIKSKEQFAAVLEEDWETFKSNCGEDLTRGLPMTLAGNYPIHLAVYCNKYELLEDLLVKCRLLEDADKKNFYGNTALHDAATTNNIEAVKLLVRKNPNLCKTYNKVGETPLFKAAAFGRTKIVKFLAYSGQIDRDGKLLPEHRFRRDFEQGRPGTSILHIAVQGEHFGTRWSLSLTLSLSTNVTDNLTWHTIYCFDTETALLLLKLDITLNNDLEDNDGMTCLQLLANMPSAFKSGYPMGLFKSILYSCFPNIEDNDNDEVSNEVNDTPSHSAHLPRSNKLSIWRRLCATDTELPKKNSIWEANKKHQFALKLAKKLIKEDRSSWLKKHVNKVHSNLLFCSNVGVEEENNEEGKRTETQPPTSIQGQGETQSKTHSSTETPLLLATRHGIIEIVKEILKEYPQAIDHCSDNGQNILLMAFKYRQKEIFDLIKEKKIPMKYLVRGIDKDGYTLLHHAAGSETKGTGSGPAFQLQAELKWFKRAKKWAPSHYARHIDNKEKKTADKLFEEKHANQLKKAQKWIKETSQSCSAVAVLIATVVFAAAYTLPGGIDSKGVPNFIHSPFFFFFTIMDVASLGSSLTSVVTFLSILSSPFEQEDFEHSLPRKLTLGFTLLFISVATTMLAFAATLVLVIQLNNKQWTTTVIYASAFFPVTVFALMQFPLYTAFMGTMRNFFKKVKKFVSRLPGKTKNHINMAREFQVV